MRFLFDRLLDPGAGNHRSRDALAALVGEEIARGIQCLASQRNYFYGLEEEQEGSARHLPDTVLNFGLAVPVSENAHISVINELARQIRHLILRYEPRLERPEVSVHPRSSPFSPGTIHVTGTFRVDGTSFPVETRIDMADVA